MIYNSIRDSWTEPIYSKYLLHNISVVDTHGFYYKGAMYWLLEATESLIVSTLENKRRKILEVGKPH